MDLVVNMWELPHRGRTIDQSMEHSTLEREVEGSIPGTGPILLERNEKWTGGTAFALQWPSKLVVLRPAI